MKWPRYSEMLLAVWLLAAPAVLDHGHSPMINIVAALAILLLDILSITFYKRYAHLGILGVVAGMLVHAYVIAPPEAAGTENNIVVALLLLMLAILPTEATLPPPSWRKIR